LPIRSYHHEEFGNRLANDRDNDFSSALSEWETRLQQLVSSFQGEMTSRLVK
jgi:hypothetical protein